MTDIWLDIKKTENNKKIDKYSMPAHKLRPTVPEDLFGDKFLMTCEDKGFYEWMKNKS